MLSLGTNKELLVIDLLPTFSQALLKQFKVKMLECPMVLVELCFFQFKAMFFEQKQAGFVQHFDYTNVQRIEAFFVLVIDGSALLYDKLHHVDVALG